MDGARYVHTSPTSGSFFVQPSVVLTWCCLEESSLQRILGDHITFVHAIDCQVWVHSFFIDVLEIDRSDIDVLYQSADRPNIYTQLRPSKEAVDIMYKFLKRKSFLSFHLRNLKNELGFLVPVFCDKQFNKAQIFTTTRFLCDIIGTDYNSQLQYLMNIAAAWLTRELRKHNS